MQVHGGGFVSSQTRRKVFRRAGHVPWDGIKYVFPRTERSRNHLVMSDVDVDVEVEAHVVLARARCDKLAEKPEIR
jgi:hypothetical protein